MGGQADNQEEGWSLPLLDLALLALVYIIAAIVILPLVRAQQTIEEPDTPEQITDQVFVLTEAAGYTFKSGRWDDAEVAQRVHDQIVPQIVRRIRNEGFNLVQVVGFTDGTAMNGGSCSGWDGAYAQALQKGSNLPTPCTNIELGKLRAGFVGKTIFDGLPADLTDTTIMTSGSGPDQFLGDNPGTQSSVGRRQIKIFLLRIGD